MKTALCLALTLLAAGCAAKRDDTAGASDDINAERNEDVQVLKVYDSASFSLVKSMTIPYLDPESCAPEGGISWEQIKLHDRDKNGELNVTIDCTEAIGQRFGAAPMRVMKFRGHRLGKTESAYLDFGDDHVFHTLTVELVVKQGAVDAPSLNGLGFYLNKADSPSGQPRPQPGANDGSSNFLSPDRVRTAANRYPATKLKFGDSARVVKVVLPISYPTAGSTYSHAFYFRPFTEYLVGGDKFQKFDPVATDYYVTQSTEFDRENDILSK